MLGLIAVRHLVVLVVWARRRALLPCPLCALLACPRCALLPCSHRFCRVLLLFCRRALLSHVGVHHRDCRRLSSSDHGVV